MKRKTLLQYFAVHNNSVKDFFRIMRISLLLLFVCVCQLMATDMDAQNTIVKIKQNNISIKQLIKEIELQTDYLVVFRNQDVDVDKLIFFKKTSAKVTELLEEVCRNANINYVFENNYITLSKGIQEIKQNKKKVTGVVIDAKGEPIIGANVVEIGTSNGIITDVDGNYSLEVGDGATLQFSFIGYLSQSVNVKGKTVLNITMQEDTQALDEVVVVGYGTMRKRDLTGAVAQVRPDKLLKGGITTVQDILRTGVPGLNVGVSSSAKGGGSLQVRGQRSLSGNNDPLIVVDNVIFFGELSEINPQDIDQLDVLKDASSAAVFGAKSANGVIIITTKKGKSEKPTVRFDANWGVVTMGRQRKVYDANEYLDFRSDWFDSQTGFVNPGKYRQPTATNLKKYGLTIDEWRAMSVEQGTDDEIWLSRLGLFDKEK